MRNHSTRRQFLQASTAVVTAGKTVLNASWEQSYQSLGLRYEKQVSDTLDLAERGTHVINALTGSADPEHGYESYHGTHLDQRPPYMSHRWGGPCCPKPVEALPGIRLMSGSTLNRDYDRKMMEWLIDGIENNGLWWL